MNLDELQSVRDRERQTDKLQQLRESFYADAGEFIQQLRTERERAADRADDPFDAPEVNRLTDEINTAEQTVEAIYEKRVGKVVKAASFAAADLPSEADGMTAEEQELFDTLVENIKENRSYVLDVLSGDESTDNTASTEPPPEPAGAADEAGVSAADVMGGSAGQPDEPAPTPPTEVPPEESLSEAAPDPPVQAKETASGGTEQTSPSGDQTAAPPDEDTQLGDPASTEDHQAQPPEYPVREDGGTDARTAKVDRETVRITESVDTFVGSDERDYDLDRNDIVTLPSTNAQLLLKRDVAEQIE